MCGIVGYLGPYTRDIQKIFKDLLIVNSLRGEDSTGVVLCHPHKQSQHAKALGDPTWLLYGKAWKPIANTIFKSVGFIGHCRSATKGDVSIENAHPFVYKDHYVVHNGTVKTDGLLKEEHKNKVFETDSETIAFALAHYGIEDVWSKINGGTCLVYWNDRTKELHLIRNNDRPMFFAFLESEKHIVFASEAWMIRGCVARNDGKILENKVFSLNEHWLKTFSFKKDKLEQSSKKLVPYSPPKTNIVPLLPALNKPFTNKADITFSSVAKTVSKLTKAFEQWDITHPKDNIEHTAASWSERIGNGAYCHSCGGKLAFLDRYWGADIGNETFLCQICTEYFSIVGFNIYFDDFCVDAAKVKENVA